MKNRKGFTLVASVIATLCVGIMLAAMFDSVAQNINMAAKQCDTVRAYYAAEAGLVRKFIELRRVTPYLGNISDHAFSIGTSRTGKYDASISCTNTGARFLQYRIISTGTCGAAVRTLTLDVTQTSFSRWGHITNKEETSSPRINWMMTGNSFEGPWHTNGQLHVFGDPIFYGPVTTGGSAIDYYSGTNNPDFQGGITLGVPQLQIPLAADCIGPIFAAAQLAYKFTHLPSDTGRTTIAFNADGTMDVVSFSKYSDSATHNIPMPPNGAIYVENPDGLNIFGKVSGNVTVGVDGPIFIRDNLTYADSTPTTTDMLGLIAKDNITITKKKLDNDDGPSDMRIDGYLVSVLGGIYNEDDGVDSIRNSITLFGGSTSELSGAFGHFSSSGTPINGFKNEIHKYDVRLLTQTPLYFPVQRDNTGRIVYIKVRWSCH